jgi:hypothetical protein
MKKLPMSLGLLALALFFAMPVSMASLTDSKPAAKHCSAKNVVKNKNGTCACKVGTVWNEAKAQCTTRTLWCRDNVDKKSVYDIKKKQCLVRAPAPQQPTTPDSNSSSAILTPVEATIDDSDPQNGSNQFDFETGKTSTSEGVDLSIGGIVFNGQWMPSVDWNVVILNDTFENVKECPATGYGNADNVDAKGFGTPRYANTGTVACLKTKEGHYVKLQILEATYDSVKDWRILKFKYLISKDGSRQF